MAKALEILSNLPPSPEGEDIANSGAVLASRLALYQQVGGIWLLPLFCFSFLFHVPIYATMPIANICDSQPHPSLSAWRQRRG